MLAALVPERVLPFASGGSRKRGPGRVGFPAHDRGGAPKGERSRLSGRGCARALRRGNCWCAVRRSASLFWGAKTSLGSKDMASRPFEASFLEADPDAKRIAAMQFRAVIAGLAVVTRACVAV